MGRNAVLMVLWMTILIGSFGLALSKLNTESVRNAAQYYDYLQARSIAHSAVNITLHQIDLGSTSTSFSGGFDGGTYTIGKTVNADTVILAVSSRYTDTTYMMQIKMVKYPKPFPVTNAAVGFSSDSVDFEFSGNPSIVGKDTNPDGTAGSGAGVPGIAVPSKYDSVNLTPYGKYITATPKVKVSDSIPNPSGYINEYIVNATHHLAASVSGSFSIGSESDPAIAVREGDLHLSGSVKIYGILVVKGNLSISGTVDIYGIVIVYGEDLEVEINTSTGTPRIYGGFLMSGPAHSKFAMKGNGEYLYSSKALNAVKNAPSLRAYSILDWWE